MKNMKRYIMEELIKWKESKHRKPLILQGARQVGKTYILKEFGKQEYESIAYFNFEHDEHLQQLFQQTKDPKRILEQLSFVHGKAIVPEKTLIFFDEIQECPDALNSLKYFNEEANEYSVVAAGSLLGIRLSHTSFPVGKVDFMTMYPMSFSEFLIADGLENLVEYMSGIQALEKIPNILFEQLTEKLKAYFIIGGMPEAVKAWVKEKDIERVNKIQSNILQSYESDFAKHVSAQEANKISLIWNSIPSQLAKENKKFLYQVIKEGARAREYEGALHWLNDANLIDKVYNVTKPDMPLKAYHDLSSFKIYMHDIGLLRRMADLDSKIVIEGNALFEEFKGALTENYVLNMLCNQLDKTPNYFTFDRNEIDFIIQHKNQIIPIEVKAGKSSHHKSLTKYNQQRNPNISIRLSMDNIALDGNILNIPLFMVEYIAQFIDIIE